MRFSDGVEFDTTGPLRVEHRHDGWYVVGEGSLAAVDSFGDGVDYIEATTKGKGLKARRKYMEDFIESQEFYELMQRYRHSGILEAATAFETVKKVLLEKTT